MSDYLKTYTVNSEHSFQDSFLKDEYLSAVFHYAITSAVDSLGSYWGTEGAQSIIKENTFDYIWNKFPDQRSSLLEVMLNTINKANYGHRIKSLSEPFCRSFLTELYISTPVDDKIETNKLRATVVPAIDKDFDYLSELHRFSLIEEDKELYNLWERTSIGHSKDERLFDYLWSQVKREKGAIDLKYRILLSAMEKDALSDNLVRKIAKSSPKRLKRAVVAGLMDNKHRADRYLRSLERAEVVVELDKVEAARERVAKIESRAMLFVGCDDYKVVESLIDCLSRDNLPWLLPSASGHHWLGQRLNRLIDEGDNND